MGTNSLLTEILSGIVIPDDNLLAVIVGDSINCTLPHALSAQTTTLSRKPGGSSASVASHTWTCDLPGYYQATIAIAAFSGVRAFTVVAFPTNVQNTKLPSGGNVGRITLNSLVRDSRVTLASITAALEVATPVIGDTLLSGSKFNWAQYG